MAWLSGTRTSAHDYFVNADVDAMGSLEVHGHARERNGHPAWEAAEMVTSASSPPPAPPDRPKMNGHTTTGTREFPSVEAVDETPISVKNVCFVGAGYVGGPTAAVLALHNPTTTFTVLDRDNSRINQWKSTHLPIAEPGLDKLIRITRDGAKATSKFPSKTSANGTRRHHPYDSNPLFPSNSSQDTSSIRSPNLFFTTSSPEALSTADIIFLCVNTPTKRFGLGAGKATDLSALDGAVSDIAALAKPGAVIVEKSTVPVRTAERIRRTFAAVGPNISFEVVSSPEFLSEGTAVRNSLQPDRILIGSSPTPSGRRAAAALSSLYTPFVPASKILHTNTFSSELSKLVANAMLAQRISSMNSIAAVCERTGADITEVAKAVGLDARIGNKFLGAGLGFGGSCFRKDIASLTYLAESLGLPDVSEYWQQVLHVNELQRRRFATKMVGRLGGSLVRKKITLLGFAFKAKTGDTRESLAVDIIAQLLEERPAEIAIFDPGCGVQSIWQELGRGFGDDAGWQDIIRVYEEPYEACEDAMAVAVLTEWDMFAYPPRAEAASKPQKVQAPPTGHDSLRNGANGHLTYKSFLPMPDAATANGIHVAAPDVETFDTDTHTFLLQPEPSCPRDCSGCAAKNTQVMKGNRAEKTHEDEPLEWDRVIRDMQAPKWVFDGRGMLDGQALEELGMGVRVEAIGKARAEEVGGLF